MTAIGNIQRGTETRCVACSPRVVVACCVALTVLAALAIALSSWANVKIVSMHGADAIIHQSPYTIMLPLAFTGVCGAMMRVLLIDKPSHVNRQVTSSGTPIVAGAIRDLEHILPAPKMTVSPAPGRCVRFLVKEGDVVEANTVICVIEAMKMETSMRAGAAGRIVEIYTQQGSNVEQGDPLFRLQEATAQ